MFALVRYEIDNTTAVVSARNIKDFCPVTCEDFNPDLLYDVFWSGNITTKGGYYHAQIVNMADCFQCQKGGAEETAPLYYVDLEGQGDADEPGLDPAWSSLSAMTVECNIREVNASQTPASQPIRPLAPTSGEGESGAMMGAPVKAGVWRVASPRTPSPAGGACTLGARCLVVLGRERASFSLVLSEEDFLTQEAFSFRGEHTS
ncbi:hypothetical protein HPB47_018126 [Ixodes persulcatus]|uniref:Uncharacterized protein n=1 Tax=Ixodes persulcatus TaxID=34615 RepID=A0AC60QMC1_IXOPE|nr:hypothetical protein HPB47_018126 [Ixodes persulcatus]